MNIPNQDDGDDLMIISSSDEDEDNLSSSDDEKMDQDKEDESTNEVESSGNEDESANEVESSGNENESANEVESSGNENESANEVESSGNENESANEVESAGNKDKSTNAVESSVNEDESEKKEEYFGNIGLADVFSKILNTRKPKNKKTIVLAKAKKLSSLKAVVKPQVEDFEVVGDSVDNDTKPPLEDSKDELTKKILSEYKITKKEFDSRGRLKASDYNPKKERELAKNATRGIIQLFNAVNKQQNVLNTKLNSVGTSIIKKDKVMKEIVKNKQSFLDVIVNSGTKQTAEQNETKSEPEDEDSDTAPSNNWSVLRQDFMQSANLKDWDKED